MNEKDFRVKRTKAHLEKAMNILLRKKDIKEISIKELAELAEISRQTFYKHYDTKEELYLACAENFFIKLNERIALGFEEKGIELVEDKYEYIFEVHRQEIEQIKLYMSIEDKDLIMKSLNKANVMMVELIGLDMDYEGRQLVVDMLSGMVYVMIRKWVERKDHEDKEIIHAISNVFTYVSR